MSYNEKILQTVRVLDYIMGVKENPELSLQMEQQRAKELVQTMHLLVTNSQVNNFLTRYSKGAKGADKFYRTAAWTDRLNDSFPLFRLFQEYDDRTVKPHHPPIMVGIQPSAFKLSYFDSHGSREDEKISVLTAGSLLRILGKERLPTEGLLSKFYMWKFHCGDVQPIYTSNSLTGPVLFDIVTRAFATFLGTDYKTPDPEILKPEFRKEYAR